jgi:AraC-like DNA-binding protein
VLLGRVPTPPLSDVVEVLWYAEDWQPVHAKERHMPDGSAGLIVSLSGGRGSDADRAIVTGPRSQAFVLDTSEPNTVMGAQFRKGRAGVFLDMPVEELHNVDARVADVCGASAASLRERLLDAAGPDARLDLLERWLHERLVRGIEIDPAIAWAVRQFERRPGTRVGDVTNRIGRSARWFVNRFAGDTGMTPKVFSRVQRFQHALRRAHARTDISLADLAAAAGYFDQAHFNHDFRSIAGMTPGEYLAGRTAFLNHVVIRE